MFELIIIVKSDKQLHERLKCIIFIIAFINLTRFATFKTDFKITAIVLKLGDFCSNVHHDFFLSLKTIPS